MKKVTSTLTLLLLCIYVSAQVGSLDAANFNSPNGYVINALSIIDDRGNSMAIQSDGKIVVAVVTTDNSFKVVRYLTNGSLDPNFGTAGVATFRLGGSGNTCQSYAVAMQGNNIIVGGWAWVNNGYDFALARLDQDGAQDMTFGTGGYALTAVSPLSGIGSNAGPDEIRDIVVLSDGSIIAAGYSHNAFNNDFAVAKYTNNGSLVTSFGGSSTGYRITDVNNDDMVSKMAVTSTGEIVVVGTSNIGTNTDDYAIVRYTSGGILDVNFNTTGIVTSGIGNDDEAFGVAIQSNDRIVITGYAPATLSSTTNDLLVARYRTDGTLDTDFDTDGINIVDYAGGDDEGHAVAIQSNGSIVVAGITDAASFDFHLARFTSAGGLDGTFGTSGQSSAEISTADDFVYDVKLSGSKIYVTGNANYTGSTTRDFALASFINNFNTLPITLTNFYGQKQMDKVVLQWQTSMEEDVKQFIIERSSDGKTYKSIGQVAAVGNSNTTQHYSFADQSPFTSANNFYRLLIQDVDGNTKYSKILIIKFGGELTANMQLFPNPVKDILQIQIPSGLNGIISLQIIDIGGRVIRNNNFASDGNALNTSIDVSNLQKGLYILKAQAGNTSVLTRFVKQ